MDGVRQQQGWGKADNTQGERIWSSLGRHKVKRGLLVINFLCPILTSSRFGLYPVHNLTNFRPIVDADYNPLANNTLIGFFLPAGYLWL